MISDTVTVTITMVLYMAVVIGIGLYFAKRANKSSDEYFLGGRSLGPWVSAMSAEASDMSGYLLMGVPGVAYWFGLSDAFWTALGLAVGTYLNWLIVAKRLRTYSHVAGDAITIPDFFSNRFKEDKKILMGISSIFIIFFFIVYAASCFVTMGKLFQSLFGFNYHGMIIIGAIFVVLYTFIGGFLAESTSDFMQAIVMIFALSMVTYIGLKESGGIAGVVANLESFPGFLEFFGIAQPELVDGVQQISSTGEPLFGPAGDYSTLTIISTLSWGLGYFGMPQVLLRFMAIRKPEEVKSARRIATIWVVISLFTAVLIGLIGRSIYPTAFTTQGDAENIFILTATQLLPPVFAGLAMAGILAATISSADSYLLIAASAVSKNLFLGIFKKEANDRDVMKVSRITLVVIAILGILIALDENSVIFNVVAFAWAGFGATFGPIMLFSLFWKRVTHQGAIAGMVSGGITVIVWRLLIKPLGGIFNVYELLPAFVLSAICIVVVSLLTPEPSAEIQAEFEEAGARG